MKAQACLADSNMIMTRIPDEGLCADDGGRQGGPLSGERELHGHAEVLSHGGVTAAGEQRLAPLTVIIE